MKMFALIIFMHTGYAGVAVSVPGKYSTEERCRAAVEEVKKTSPWRVTPFCIPAPDR